jgi:hypothetical protein
MALAERLTRPNVNMPMLAGIGLALAAVIIFAGNYKVEDGENGGTGPGIFTAVVCVALAAALFGYVVPRATNLNRTALILGILAVLSVVVFWSGVTPVLTMAAIAVSKRGDSQPSRAVVIVEALAVLASVLAVVVTVSSSHLF